MMQWRASLGDHTHHERYQGLVPAELGNVVLHPGERKFLVEKTEVVIRSRKFLCRWETKNVRTVVEGHKDDVLIFCEGRAVIPRE